MDDFVPGDDSFFYDNESLTTNEIILPSIGVIILCITTFLLLGLVAIYFKIFFTSQSKYVIGLLFFLLPLLIQSFFFINAMRSLFLSAKITYFGETLGFGLGGLGRMLLLISLFEGIGLCILLYLSAE